MFKKPKEVVVAQEQIEKLKTDTETWNRWRASERNIRPILSGANLRGANLATANLSGVDLTKADLRGANLEGADLRGANLSGADLEAVNLTRANLSEACLPQVNLKEACLTGVNLSRAHLVGVDLSAVDLSGTNLSDANFSGADFMDILCGAEFAGCLSRTDLSCTNLSGADLSGVDLSGANLSEANLSEANLIGANLSDADLSGANLSDSRLSEVFLKGANLNKASLTGADLSRIELSGVSFDGTDLSGVYLSEADLSGIDLSGADFRGVDLSWMDLSGSDLRKANLSGANLSEANLRGSDLSEADLSRVNLEGAKVLGTNFSGAVLTGACIKDWNTNRATQLKGVRADYVYLDCFLKTDSEKVTFSVRRPEFGVFKLGEFSILFQQAIDTLDLVFIQGIDWQAFLKSFQELCSQYSDEEISVQAIERKSNGAFLIRLEIPASTNKSAIESRYKELYALQIAALETQYEQVLKLKGVQIEDARRAIEIEKKEKASLLEIVKTMAVNQGQTNEFHGPVGNVVGTAESGSRVQSVLHNYASEQRKNLVVAAKEIQELLDQLSTTYPVVEVPGQAVEQIQQNPQLKERVMGALKGGGKTALEKLIDHPAISIVLAAIEGAISV